MKKYTILWCKKYLDYYHKHRIGIYSVSYCSQDVLCQKNRFLVRKILITNVSNDTEINAKELYLTIYPFFLYENDLELILRTKKLFRFCFVGIIVIKIPKIKNLLQKMLKYNLLKELTNQYKMFKFQNLCNCLIQKTI